MQGRGAVGQAHGLGQGEVDDTAVDGHRGVWMEVGDVGGVGQPALGQQLIDGDRIGGNDLGLTVDLEHEGLLAVDGDLLTVAEARVQGGRHLCPVTGFDALRGEECIHRERHRRHVAGRTVDVDRHVLVQGDTHDTAGSDGGKNGSDRHAGTRGLGLVDLREHRQGQTS